MATALFTDAESICYDVIIKIIRKIKNQHQRKDNINSNHKKIIRIPEFQTIMFPKNSSIFE